MPKLDSKQVPATLAAVLAFSTAACGDQGEGRNLLTDGRSTALLDLLDQAEEQFEGDDCDALAATVQEFQAEVSEISSDVSPEVRSTLNSEAADLASLSQQCEPPEPAPAPEPVPEPAPEPEPEPEPAPEPEPEPEPEPVPPDDGGGDDGGGEGNGGSGENGESSESSGESGSSGRGVLDLEAAV